MSAKNSKKKMKRNLSESTIDEQVLETKELDKQLLNESPKIDANLIILSWNVNGLRAWTKKSGLNDLEAENADIICLQETKCPQKDVPQKIEGWTQYPFKYWSPAEKDGYSGVCLLSKKKPKSVEYGIGIEKHDCEGRVITAEFDSFYLVNAYVPNSGRGLIRHSYRMEWDRDFTHYLKKLDQKKAVILCGDLNVSHQEIDLENPKTNTKTAGFTPEERENFTKLLSEGFVDSFRKLYPNLKKCYTFWSYMKNARLKDIGWRLDYFVISERMTNNLCDNQIRSKVMGSDHCPILLSLNIQDQNPETTQKSSGNQNPETIEADINVVNKTTQPTKKFKKSKK